MLPKCAHFYLFFGGSKFLLNSDDFCKYFWPIKSYFQKKKKKKEQKWKKHFFSWNFPVFFFFSKFQTLKITSMEISRRKYFFRFFFFLWEFQGLIASIWISQAYPITFFFGFIKCWQFLDKLYVGVKSRTRPFGFRTGLVCTRKNFDESQRVCFY